ncbi:MAG: cytochrome c oxidase subunit 3 [Candidatus Hydrogenedentes bacterium]|nr:cytochrome c oxidase subunit 3 [Candidatus Hydrogenedentota bacterium]
MTTPYTTELRPDTGLYNAKLGIWLFLAAEAMFFGALFSSYVFLRTASDSWPNGAEILPVGVAIVTTVVMLLAGVCSARAWSDLQRSDRGHHARWMWATIAAGFAAIICIAIEYGAEAAEGMSAATNTFYACWYLLTGVHRIHVVVAIGYTLYLGLPGSTLRATDPQRYRNRVECLGLFWQFLGLMWLCIFACFYVA